MTMNLSSSTITLLSKEEYWVQEAKSFEFTQVLQNVLVHMDDLREFTDWVDEAPSGLPECFQNEFETYEEDLEKWLNEAIIEFNTEFDKLTGVDIAIRLYDGEVVKLIDYNKKEGSFYYINKECEEEQIDFRGITDFYILNRKGD